MLTRARQREIATSAQRFDLELAFVFPHLGRLMGPEGNGTALSHAPDGRARGRANIGQRRDV